MLSIFDAGNDTFRLTDSQDREVGWIRGNAIGFDGFASEGEALAAAVAGAEALATFLVRLTGTIQPVQAPTGEVHTIHDGAYEWAARGKSPLARLYRPERDRPRRDGRGSFGVEFMLPSYVRPGSAIGAAQVVHRAIATAADRPARTRQFGQHTPAPPERAAGTR